MRMKEFERAMELHKERRDAKVHFHNLSIGHTDIIRVLDHPGKKYILDIVDPEACNHARISLMEFYHKKITKLDQEIAALGIVP